jgi:hypothetical protein
MTTATGTLNALAARYGIPRALSRAFLLNLLWVNTSEIFRYFAFVKPMMTAAFPQLPDIVPLNLPVFLSWCVWDTILVAAVTGFTWLYLDRFGGGLQNAFMAGTCAWVAMFLLLWLGLWNMNLTPAKVALVALPLAWIEMVVAAALVNWARRR